MEQTVRIPPSGVTGDLFLPDRAKGIIVFAHGSGSSRHSPRNRSVAGTLQGSGFGTLLLDLLTEAEEEEDLRTRNLRFDISLLADRLKEASEWLLRDFGEMSLGYFGASTGAAAALAASAGQPKVKAVVSRGGRPDLAGSAILRRVTAPTLLIVGGNDGEVVELNQKAMREMHCAKEFAIVVGATHLFEERGALERVSVLALDWFEVYFRS